MRRKGAAAAATSEPRNKAGPGPSQNESDPVPPHGDPNRGRRDSNRGQCDPNPGRRDPIPGRWHGDPNSVPPQGDTNSVPPKGDPNSVPPRGSPKPGRSRGDRERGSATVLATGIVAALVVSAMAFTAVGQATAARHRAQGAADAAALAGASKVLLGDGESCAAARAMAEDAAVELERCEVRNLEVTVYVSVEASGIPAAFGPARAVSRAGPVKVE